MPGRDCRFAPFKCRLQSTAARHVFLVAQLVLFVFVKIGSFLKGYHMKQQEEIYLGTKESPVAGKEVWIRNFLGRFERAIAAGDAEVLARLCATPSLMISENFSMALTSHPQAKDFFSGALLNYTSHGATLGRPHISSLEWVTEDMAFVNVQWAMVDKKKQESGFENAFYILKCDESGEVKIQTALMRRSISTVQ
jgi:hypothetical protein